MADKRKRAPGHRTLISNDLPDPAMPVFEKRLFLCVIGALVGLFAFSLFKNIQYPLIWSDEGDTVVYGASILKHGYPKVHDGKNVLTLNEMPDKTIGVNKRWDAWTSLPWFPYYFSTAGIFLANHVSGIYSKTLLLRLPFGMIGFLGILVIAYAALQLFHDDDRYKKLLFLAMFFLGELLSVSLVLHLREVRSYPINFFLFGCMLYLFIDHLLFGKVPYLLYALSMISLLVVAFNTFFPLYFVMAAPMGLLECVRFYKSRDVKEFIKNLAPLAASFIAVLPFLAFYDVLRVSREYEKFYSGVLFKTTPLQTYCKNMAASWAFFVKYEFLYAVIFTKAVSAAVWHTSSRAERIQRPYISARGANIAIQPGDGLRRKHNASNMFVVFFLFYLLLINKVPLGNFERYFILLQPVLVIIFLLDMFIIFELAARRYSAFGRNVFRVALLSCVFILCAINAPLKAEMISNHIYELFHQYKGPLDFAIPYIQSRYEDPSKLVIATNYEDYAYMYYLQSRVIVGYVGGNLEEDLAMEPDIIIYRKKWTFVNSAIRTFFQKAHYEKISLPVADYIVNNIPESSYHLYRTRFAQTPEGCLDIYIKTTDAVRVAEQ